MVQIRNTSFWESCIIYSLMFLNRQKLIELTNLWGILHPYIHQPWLVVRIIIESPSCVDMGDSWMFAKSEFREMALLINHSRVLVLVTWSNFQMHCEGLEREQVVSCEGSFWVFFRGSLLGIDLQTSSTSMAHLHKGARHIQTIPTGLSKPFWPHEPWENS